MMQGALHGSALMASRFVSCAVATPHADAYLGSRFCLLVDAMPVGRFLFGTGQSLV